MTPQAVVALAQELRAEPFEFTTGCGHGGTGMGWTEAELAQIGAQMICSVWEVWVSVLCDSVRVPIRPALSARDAPLLADPATPATPYMEFRMQRVGGGFRLSSPDPQVQRRLDHLPGLVWRSDGWLVALRADLRWRREVNTEIDRLCLEVGIS